MPELYPRHNRRLILEALADTRVVLVLGARQVGKSTLADDIARTDYPAHRVDLDERDLREVALADPEGFIADLETPALIDEVQRGGEDLLLAIKAAVDADKTPGRFLLTGSANALSSRRTYGALTGRVETIRLWPLSQSEVHGSKTNVVDGLFAGQPPRIADAPRGRDAFAEAIAAGGFPEARGRSSRRRERWFEDYVRSTIERDLRDLSDAHKLELMPQLLRALAARAGGIVDHQKIARRLGMDAKTVKSYTHLLELVFVVKTVPAWRPGITAREGKKPKVHLVDSGLLLSLLGADERRVRKDDQVTGKAVESFVAMEVVKHVEWAETRADLFHYRGSNQEEVDLVLESRSGEIVAIEAKAAATVTARDLRQLAKLRDGRPDRFRAGVLFYAGRRTLRFGDRLWAVPLSGLWEES